MQQMSISYAQQQSDNPPSYASVVAEISSPISIAKLQPQKIRHVKRVDACVKEKAWYGYSLL